MRQKDIADSLGISVKTIQRWQKMPAFVDALESLQVQATATTSEIVKDTLSQRDHLRAKELALLDRMEAKLLSCIDSDELGYRIVGVMQCLLKLSERRSKLLGLDIRSMSTLDAIQVLLQEEILSTAQAGIVFEGVKSIEENLRVVEIEKESKAEIQAIKNLSAEQLAQEYRTILNN